MSEQLADERLSGAARAYLARLAASPLPARLAGAPARIARTRPRRTFSRLSIAAAVSVCVILVVALPLLLVRSHVTNHPSGHPLPIVSPSSSPAPTAQSVPGLPCLVQPGTLLTLT